MKDNIILIGGGGHCKSVIDVIEKENKYNIIGIIDKKEKLGEKILDYKIIGIDADLKEIRKDITNAVITIGQIKDWSVRFNIYNLLKKLNFNLPVIISPLAYVSKSASVDEGTVIMHFAFLNSSSKVGKCCIINTKAIIEHDAQVGDFCHISTGSIINGGVKVGSFSFIGSNSTTKQYIEIPEYSFIKAGSLLK